MSRLRTGLVIAAASAGAGLVANKIASSRKAHQGEHMEREMWELLKARRYGELAELMAPGFLGVDQDKTFNRDESIALTEQLNIGDYDISDFRTSQEGPTIVLTYKCSVAETIDGKRLPAERSLRQSVWLKTDQGWKWVSHANLRSL